MAVTFTEMGRLNSARETRWSDGRQLNGARRVSRKVNAIVRHICGQRVLLGGSTSAAVALYLKPSVAKQACDRWSTRPWKPASGVAK